MKFNKPKIAKCIDKKIADCMIDNEFSNGIFNEEIDENIKLESITFDGCVFENINFQISKNCLYTYFSQIFNMFI